MRQTTTHKGPTSLLPPGRVTDNLVFPNQLSPADRATASAPACQLLNQAPAHGHMMISIGERSCDRACRTMSNYPPDCRVGNWELLGRPFAAVAAAAAAAAAEVAPSPAPPVESAVEDAGRVR